MSKTKKSLLLSCLSMLLCVTMLIGSTFAWFTDNASTGLNSIQAGTLDIDVQYTQDGMSWSNLDNATDLFAGALWEPGHTRVVALKVTNNGSLALKYQMGMNIVSETMGTNVYGDPFKLSDYLEVSTLAQQANDSMGVGNITLSVAFQGENAVGYEYTNKLTSSPATATICLSRSICPKPWATRPMPSPAMQLPSSSASTSSQPNSLMNPTASAAATMLKPTSPM